MSIVRKYIFVFAGLLMTAKAFGQAAPSPFSNFGIGESYGNGLIHNQGMGGTGVAQPQYWFLNNQNPALLVFNTLTIFEAGLTVEQRKIRSNELTEKVTGGNMNYLVTAFPVKVGKWTTSLGLMPLSSVNYKLAYEGEIEGSTNKVEVTEEGKGGLTQLYWSNGVRISPDFSVGIKASYVFSSILSTYKNRLINSTNPINYYSAVEQRSYVKDFMFTAGLSYSKDSIRNKDYRFSAGLVYTLGTDLRTTKTDKLYRTTQLGDTIESVILSRARGNIYLPANITVGFSYSKGARWVVATEFSYQDWSQFKSVNKDDEGLENGWRASLGGEITPDALGVDNYLKRITYRTGVSYEQYPFMANNKSVKDLGINFGLSLPTGRSSLDLAVKFGKRGNKAENILEENYFRLFFGITFNDQWFIKRKFD